MGPYGGPGGGLSYELGTPIALRVGPDGLCRGSAEKASHLAAARLSMAESSVRELAWGGGVSRWEHTGLTRNQGHAPPLWVVLCSQDKPCCRCPRRGGIFV